MNQADKERYEYNKGLENDFTPEDALYITTNDLMAMIKSGEDLGEITKQLKSFAQAISRAEEEKVPYGTLITIIDCISEKFISGTNQVIELP